MLRRFTTKKPESPTPVVAVPPDVAHPAALALQTAARGMTARRLRTELTEASKAARRHGFLLIVAERHSPRLKGFLLALYNLAGAAILAIALWHFLPSFLSAWDRPERHFMGNPGFFQIPTWPLYGLMSIGMAATILQFLANTIAALRGEDV